MLRPQLASRRPADASSRGWLADVHGVEIADGEYPVIGVIGGSGGVGCSSLAAVLALAAASDGDGSMLVDVDAVGGGIDVLLGIEHRSGARWSGLRLDGGRLERRTLVDALPQLGSCAVLAADESVLDEDAVAQVIGAASGGGPVVLDLPRGRCPERDSAVARCGLVVLLARGDVPGLVAARSIASSLGDEPLGLVVRQGEVRAVDAAALVGVELLGELPGGAALSGPLDPDRPPPGFAALADGVLAGLSGATGRTR